MSVVNGKNVTVEIEDSGIYKLYACGRSCTLDITSDLLETSITGTGVWATYMPSRISGTATIDGVVNLDTPGMLTLADLRNRQYSQDLLRVRFTRDDTVGHSYIDEFKAYISNSSDTGSYNDVATFSISLQISGPVTSYGGTGGGGGGGPIVTPGPVLELEQGGGVELEQGGFLEIP